MIQTRRLTKSYGTRRVLDEVSLHIPERDFAVVLGPSGSGKSTLFRTVIGLVRPDSGQVLVDGISVNGDRKRLPELRKRVAPVFQGFHLVPRLSALTNVLIGRLPFVYGWKAIIHRFNSEEIGWAKNCLEDVGLSGKMQQRVDTLSGGEQQRVAIARGLAQRARVFYADEPISNLDPKLGIQILDLLREINERGATVVCNLHQVDLAREYSRSVIGLKEGKVLFDQGTADLSENDYHQLYESH